MRSLVVISAKEDELRPKEVPVVRISDPKDGRGRATQDAKAERSCLGAQALPPSFGMEKGSIPYSRLSHLQVRCLPRFARWKFLRIDMFDNALIVAGNKVATALKLAVLSKRALPPFP
ncbi:MAG: hypothetical protein Q9N02_11550 [Ghiorsea sp.]|nr:hypothetical protein [Ghiorsea sp.]